MDIFYYTFGCKVNQYETENLREKLSLCGYGEAKSIKNADICLVNTCTVTAQSDSKCMQLLRRIRKENPRCVLVAAGCMTQAFPSKAAGLDCDITVGSHNKNRLPELIEKFLRDGKRIVEITPHKAHEPMEEMFNRSVEAKTRAYIKIQDGCDMSCTYCIIPKARGHIRSKPLEVIRREAQSLIQSGHKELILTGINLCCYGRDMPNGLRLIDAIEAVCGCEGDYRVRLGSIEPEMLSDGDIERMRSCERLCPQFHLSLQSGCDKTLKAMNRKYTTDEYRLLCNKLRAAFAGCAITADIMVGFASETDEDFEKSKAFVKEIGFADAHIFPYSVRSGTVAAEMPGQVDGAVKHRRAAEMSEICKASRRDYLVKQVGTVQRVLFEKEKTSDFHIGHTDNYVTVKIPWRENEDSLRRSFYDVLITEAHDDCCFGELTKKGSR